MKLELFHTGYVVDDLEAAMSEVGAATGMTWRPILDRPELRVRTESGEHVVHGRRTYSVEGPPYLELIAVDGDVWGEGKPGGSTHLGYWVDDLATSARELEAQGLRMVVSDAATHGGFEAFAYFQSAAGPLIEILPRSRRAQILGEDP